MTEIPKIIHQIWSEINEPLPEHFRLFGETWKESHPDWKYEFWDNDRMNSFIDEYYPNYRSSYDNFPYNIQRFDAIRYLILDKMGGMYADFDTECLKPHDELIAGKTCCFSMEPKKHRLSYNMPVLFNNALMACTPEHPFMKKIIEKVFSYVPKQGELSMEQRNYEVLASTGPFMLVDIYENYSEKEDIFLIPAKYVSPFDMNEIMLIRQGYKSKEFDNRLIKAYSVHYFFGSWWVVLSEIDTILKVVEARASRLLHLGLKGGRVGVILFYFYYYRFTKNKSYEDKAFDSLKQVLSKIIADLDYIKRFSSKLPVNNNIIGLVEMGNTLLFLIEKEFVAVDFHDFFDDLDQLVLQRLNVPIAIDFSHETGLIGLCRYALHRPIKAESIKLTVNQLIKGFEKKLYDIDPVFLFPSEVLQDVKLFLSEVGKPEEITALRQHIEDFENNRTILQSRCPVYTVMQQLREAEICGDKKKIKGILTIVANESPDVVLQGLALMNLEKPTLPAWWKLF